MHTVYTVFPRSDAAATINFELCWSAATTESRAALIRGRLLSGTIHYLSDELETRAPPYYKVHISVSAIIVTGKKYRER